MGSPLSPILADIVMQDQREKVISSLLIPLPFYVDDIVLAVSSINVSDLLHLFNSFHNRLQFTIEYLNNNNIRFLDISIIINNNYLEFNWYKKTNFSKKIFIFLFILSFNSYKRCGHWSY